MNKAGHLIKRTKHKTMQYTNYSHKKYFTQIKNIWSAGTGTNDKFPSMNDISQNKKISTKVSHSCVLKNGLAFIFIFNKVEVIGRNRHFKLIGPMFYHYSIKLIAIQTNYLS